MFVLSQSVSCIPGERLCTTWLTSRKGTIAVRAIFVWPWKMVSVSVRYLFYQPVDEKIKTWPLCFPAKENPNMEKALFDWPIVLQHDVKAKYRLISRKFSGMKFFHPTVCLTNQKTRAFVSARWTNHIALFPFVSWFSFVRAFFISRSNENRSINGIKKFRSGDPGAGRGGLFKNKNNPWIWLNFFEVVVNGGWGNWSDWSACSASCGPGNSIRTRRCDSPPPGPGGNPCVGLRLENKPCNLRPCPTGKYTEQDQRMYKCE